MNHGAEKQPAVRGTDAVPDIVDHRLTRLEEDHHAIRQRIHDLSGTVQNLTLQAATIPARLDQQDRVAGETRDDVKEIKRVMVGDGTPQSPGIGSRVTSVENDVKSIKERSSKMVGALWTGGITLIVAAVKILWDILSKK